MKIYLLSVWCLLLSLCIISCKEEPNEVEYPEININMDSVLTTQVGNAISIKPELQPGEQDLTYSWTLDGISISNQLNLDYTPEHPGTFFLSLEVKNQGGKATKASVQLTVLKNKPFRVMGYLPSWRNVHPKTVRWDALTHLCFAFLKVKADGQLDEGDVKSQLKNIVEEGHKNGVAVLISVGGGGTANFSTCLLNKTSRKNLAANLIKFASSYAVDGLDIDFEEFEGSSTGATTKDLAKRSALENLYIDLRNALPEGKLLSAAVSPSWQNPNWGYYNCYTNSMFQYLDFVGLMIYDQSGTYSSSPYSQHADYSAHFLPSIDHWLNNRAVPRNKILPGVPFYGYKFKDTSGGLAEAISYQNILTQYPNEQGEYKDHLGLSFYNGKTTIEQKANYIKNNQLGGIMIWELTQDAVDNSKSLLTVIHQVLGNEN